MSELGAPKPWQVAGRRILPDTSSRTAYNKATRIDEAFSPEQLSVFARGLRTWAP